MVEEGRRQLHSPEVLAALTRFARAIKILPLRVMRESTGFVFNRVLAGGQERSDARGDSGVASIEDIDRAWMIKFGREKPPPFAQWTASVWM